jgi:hypothetical protein
VSALWTRLQRLQRTLRCCPIHGTRLECPPCDYVWAGTNEELLEGLPLLEKTRPYFTHIHPSGRLCSCGSQMWCRECYELATAKVKLPDDILTPEEDQRLSELLAMVKRRKPDGHSPAVL